MTTTRTQSGCNGGDDVISLSSLDPSAAEMMSWSTSRFCRQDESFRSDGSQREWEGPGSGTHDGVNLGELCRVERADRSEEGRLRGLLSGVVEAEDQMAARSQKRRSVSGSECRGGWRQTREDSRRKAEVGKHERNDDSLVSTK